MCGIPFQLVSRQSHRTDALAPGWQPIWQRSEPLRAEGQSDASRYRFGRYAPAGIPVTLPAADPAPTAATPAVVFARAAAVALNWEWTWIRAVQMSPAWLEAFGYARRSPRTSDAVSSRCRRGSGIASARPCATPRGHDRLLPHGAQIAPPHGLAHGGTEACAARTMRRC